MKNGYLNKTELNRITRQYREIDSLLAEIPTDRPLSKNEECTTQILTDCRNRLGELLRWQSFDVAWKAAKPD
jgi:hypothetical protein